MSFLTLDRIAKNFGASNVVSEFDLSIDRGEFVSFLGPSGCGKTTVLRMIAGFETPSSGTIRVGGEDVTALSASRRRIGMVFQSYALFPNMTASENVAFGLKVAGMDRQTIDARVKEMLSLISLDHLADRYPYQLSGGQQQRVSLARALAPSPKLLLLDEPLSALDAKIRVSLRDDIRRIQRELGITTIFVTHDQEEALSLSDRVVLINAGRIEQEGTPREVYQRPVSPYASNFFGAANLVPVTIVPDGATMAAQLADGQRIALVAAARPGPATLSVRQEDIAIEAGDAPGLAGEVRARVYLGARIRYVVRVGGVELKVLAPSDVERKAGDTVRLSVDAARVLVMPAG